MILAALTRNSRTLSGFNGNGLFKLSLEFFALVREKFEITWNF